MSNIPQGSISACFDEMRDRTDLWKLLVTITRQKAIDRIRREVAAKRGGGVLRGESALDGAQARGFQEWIQQQPTADDLVAMQEEVDRLIASLRDDSLRRVAVLRLDGHSNEAIAQCLGVTSRTVERKLKLIRDAWRNELDDQAESKIR